MNPTDKKTPATGTNVDLTLTGSAVEQRDKPEFPETGIFVEETAALLDAQRAEMEALFRQSKEAELGEEEISPDSLELTSLIARLDIHFSQFEQVIGSFINESDLPPALKDHLMTPFETYKKYIANGLARNWMTHKSPEYHDSISESDELHFAFSDQHTTPNAAYAAFQPINRTIYVRRDFNPANAFHLFVLYHELTHVHQDDEARSMAFDDAEADEISDRLEAYLSLNSHPQTKTLHEAEAYGLQLELLDIIFEGYLRNPSTNLKNPAPLSVSTPLKERVTTQILNAAKMDEKLRNILNNLFSFARFFFPTGLQDSYSQEYLEAMKVMSAREYLT